MNRPALFLVLLYAGLLGLILVVPSMLQWIEIGSVLLGTTLGILWEHIWPVEPPPSIIDGTPPNREDGDNDLPMAA